MEELEGFWVYLHPKVVELAKPRFDAGFFADSILVCLREANAILKAHVLAINHQELDGAALMTAAFSVNNPIVQLADINTANGRSIQLGYMKIFEGSMIGIRNPKAHENLNPDRTKTIHLLYNASFLFIKLQESGVLPAQ